MSTKVRLAERARAVPASPIRRLAPFAVEARRQGRTVYGLNIGQPDIPTPAVMLERLKSFDEVNVAYGPSQGLPEFEIRQVHLRDPDGNHVEIAFGPEEEAELGDYPGG